MFNENHQFFTSANTSINANRVPAIYNKIDWDLLSTCSGLYVVDWGCGKYNTGAEYIDNIGGEWLGFDPYNRSEKDNEEARDAVYYGFCSCVVCSNVLNVLDNVKAIQDVADSLQGLPYFVTVYEGDRTGNGGRTGKDQYQRNEKAKEYLKYFHGAVLKHGVITNTPGAVL